MSESNSVSDQKHETEIVVGLEGLHQLIQSSIVIPATPQRVSQHNTSATAPLTPLANLKVLAEASSALGDGGGREKVINEAAAAGEEEDSGGRKMKSLSVLCKKFLSIMENKIGIGHDFSLDAMATQLGTNRRRIYDIINILEAVEMIVKQSKNVYSWSGRNGLLLTLAKLKAMASDDRELVYSFNSDEKENLAAPTQCVAKQHVDENSQDSSVGDDVLDDGSMKGGRWDKSLGILCQKFLMLFLISPKQEVTLSKAGSVLMAEDDGSTSNSKTKVRRLYDIANVLSSLGLVRKKTFTINSHRKMPGYIWCGPSMQDIDAVPICRRKSLSETHKLRGQPLVRHRSFGSRPYLDEYEVKDSNSAPSTPCKPPDNNLVRNRLVGTRGGNSIRRSLSFGGQSSSQCASGGCSLRMKVGGVKMKSVIKPVCSREELLRELKEFEAEMTNFSHRFPNVVALFHDFMKQQLSLSKRPLLPKPCNSSTPRHLPQSSHDVFSSSQEDSGLGDSLENEGTSFIDTAKKDQTNENSDDMKLQAVKQLSGGSLQLNTFTKGILQSPKKPAPAQTSSFVPVHDFITILNNQTKEADSLLRDPRLIAKQSSHILMRQSLPGVPHVSTHDGRSSLVIADSIPPPHYGVSLSTKECPPLKRAKLE